MVVERKEKKRKEKDIYFTFMFDFSLSFLFFFFFFSLFLRFSLLIPSVPPPTPQKSQEVGSKIYFIFHVPYFVASFLIFSISSSLLPLLSHVLGEVGRDRKEKRMSFHV